MERTSDNRDQELDEFIDRVQALFMTAPYSRELRQLRQHALRNKNPDFANAFRTKAELFEQQQKMIRPDGALSDWMFAAEKGIGSLLRHRLLTFGFGSVMLMLVTGAAAWDPFRPEQPSSVDELSISEPLEIELGEFVTTATNESVDDWIDRQILVSLRSAEFRQELNRILAESEPRPATEQQLTASTIRQRLDETLAECDLGIADREFITELLLTSDFADRLAFNLNSCRSTELDEAKRPVVPNNALSNTEH